jgi:hypothetical protein
VSGAPRPIRRLFRQPPPLTTPTVEAFTRAVAAAFWQIDIGRACWPASFWPRRDGGCADHRRAAASDCVGCYQNLKSGPIPPRGRKRRSVNPVQLAMSLARAR